jgi:hypothetical protein
MELALAYYNGIYITRGMCLNGTIIDDELFIPNGTGPSNSPFITRILQSLYFNRLTSMAANVHDICYELGGAPESRKVADLIYHDLMLKIIKRDGKKLYRRTLMLKCNYWAVRMFGSSSFTYRNDT